MDGDNAECNFSEPSQPNNSVCDKQKPTQNGLINQINNITNNTYSHSSNNNKNKNNSNYTNNNDSSIENEENILDMRVTEYVAKCLHEYNLCVVDNYLEETMGVGVQMEVQEIEGLRGLEDGQLVNGNTNEEGRIRGDKIHWVDMDSTKFIGHLMHKIDRVVYALNGRIAGKVIKSRCKPMLACYPGLGTSYVRHVDNSKRDGRLLTCLYYLNKDWNAPVDGGLLRIYSQKSFRPVDIEPIFNRLLIFWSDNRNPHEVLPAFKHRYAITVWYFDEHERNSARNRLLTQ